MALKGLNIVDDLLTINHKKGFLPFAMSFLGGGIKAEWTGFSRGDTVKKEILRKMKRGGSSS